MVEEKGLSGEAADRIGEFVQMSGGQVRRKIMTCSSGSRIIALFSRPVSKDLMNDTLRSWLTSCSSPS